MNEPADGALAHVHCIVCGREMRPGTTCAACGGRGPELFVPLPRSDPEPASSAPPLGPRASSDAPGPDSAATPSNARAIPPAPGEVPGSSEVPSRASSAPIHRPQRPRPHAALHRPIPGRAPGGPSVPGPIWAPPPGFVLVPATAVAAATAPEPAPASPVTAAVPSATSPLPRPVAGAAPPAATPVAPGARAKRKFRPIDIWKRYLPPVRLVWIFLGILLALSGGLASAALAGPLLSLPVIGALVDLGFQRIRFPRLRFPDAALATSLFVAIIIWPSALDLPLASIAVVSVSLRHIARIGGHPIFNPAAAGIAIATVLFGMTTSWHLVVTNADAVAVTLLGIVLVVRAPHTWRFPVYFFASYLVVALNLAVALGATSHLALLAAGWLVPGSLFFGFFMVSEPRTAPSARWAMPIFAVLVGITSAAFPVVFTLVPVLGPIGVLAPFLSLFSGNLFTLALPSARGATHAAPTRSVARGPAGAAGAARGAPPQLAR